MRSTEFEYHLQLVRDHESSDALSDPATSAGAGLPEEQLLSSAFREIALQVQEISPSLDVEQRVMKAFDREMRIQQRYSRNWLRNAAAIAAVLLLVATISFALWRQQPRPATTGTKSPIELNAATATVDSLRDKTSLPISPVKPKRSGNASRLAGNNIHREAASPEAVAEITTDFIRINATPIESGAQMVRVSLPRSAMSQFGLPVNMNRADQPVKADVIMSIDGVAQAIRFVQ